MVKEDKDVTKMCWRHTFLVVDRMILGCPAWAIQVHEIGGKTCWVEERSTSTRIRSTSILQFPPRLLMEDLDWFPPRFPSRNWPPSTPKTALSPTSAASWPFGLHVIEDKVLQVVHDATFMRQGSSVVKPLWWTSFLCSARWVDGIVPMFHEDLPNLKSRGIRTQPYSIVFLQISTTFQTAIVNLFRTTHRRCFQPRTQPAEVWVQSEFMWTATSQQISQGKMGRGSAKHPLQARKQMEATPWTNTFLYVTTFMFKETWKPHSIPYYNRYIYIMFPKKTTKTIIIQ